MLDLDPICYFYSANSPNSKGKKKSKIEQKKYFFSAIEFNGKNIINFPTYPIEVIKLYGDYVHLAELDNLKTVEVLQLLEFANYIQRIDLIEDIVNEIMDDSFNAKQRDTAKRAMEAIILALPIIKVLKYFQIL